METASIRDAMAGDWTLIAFYYLLRVGEYTEKSVKGDSKQTVPFLMKDVTFFEFNKAGALRQMPRKAKDSRIMNATGCTLRLSMTRRMAGNGKMCASFTLRMGRT